MSISSVHIHHVMLKAADFITAGAILATFAGFLPPFAAFAAIVWYGIQIWESDTVQVSLHRRKVRRIAKRRRQRKFTAGPKVSKLDPE